ncbi:pyruvate kinase [Melittangium boletus]|uniref:pyruvate kinase n=1 Tax=Melittangium boletus TaxID=83453 RepID=UPI003DA6A014
MRKAKIVCTLGPSSDSAQVIEALIRAGMNVARLNFSHGTHDEHRQRVLRIRQAARRLGVSVAILQDIQGPKIRLGRFDGGRTEVKAGERVVVTTRNVLGQGALIPTPVRSLPRDVKPGDAILLDDGRVRLRVERVEERDVTCAVEQGGVLKDHKGLNLPGAHVSVPTVTRKDEEDLAFGQELGVDYVALSFVRTAKDIERARKLVAEHTPLIAKIEKPQAVEHLEAIARAADGIMVARGDLGVEMPLEKLPGLQKHMLRVVNRMGGLTIVATEMLESMVNNARPTRAEVSDVANAILDGADAVMLSGETAAGKYPVEAAATMARIVEETEGGSERVAMEAPFDEARDDISTGVAAAAVAAARQMGIGTIVAYTERGHTARLISEFRPEARVVALTPNPQTVHRMALYWGVTARLVGRLQSTDAMLKQVRRLCRDEGYCPAGTPVIIVAGVPLNEPGNTNMISVHRV